MVIDWLFVDNFFFFWFLVLALKHGHTVCVLLDDFEGSHFYVDFTCSQCTTNKLTVLEIWGPIFGVRASVCLCVFLCECISDCCDWFAGRIGRSVSHSHSQQIYPLHRVIGCVQREQQQQQHTFRSNDAHFVCIHRGWPHCMHWLCIYCSPTHKSRSRSGDGTHAYTDTQLRLCVCALCPCEWTGRFGIWYCSSGCNCVRNVSARATVCLVPAWVDQNKWRYSYYVYIITLPHTIAARELHSMLLNGRSLAHSYSSSWPFAWHITYERWRARARAHMFALLLNVSVVWCLCSCCCSFGWILADWFRSAEVLSRA